MLDIPDAGIQMTAATYFTELQDRICRAFEDEDGHGKFSERRQSLCMSCLRNTTCVRLSAGSAWPGYPPSLARLFIMFSELIV